MLLKRVLNKVYHKPEDKNLPLLLVEMLQRCVNCRVVIH